MTHDNIPPLPPGWLFYGQSAVLHQGNRNDIIAFNPDWETSKWDFTGWKGSSSILYYAIRAGTELARLNGLEPVSTRPEGLPAELPDPPAPPEGMKWVYRGKNWVSKKPSIYAVIGTFQKWNVNKDPSNTFGIDHSHYLEAVPIEPAPEMWTFASKAWPEINGLRQQIKDLTTTTFDQAARITELQARVTTLNNLLVEVSALADQREF